ncbi:MAG: mechanosensitive ion channel family protein [Planctomycetota bacterium]
MSLGEILHVIGWSLAVFLPVLVAAGILGYLATRTIPVEAVRRRQRWLIGAASVLLAGAATGLYWARGPAEVTLRRALITVAVPLAVYLLLLIVDNWLHQVVKDDPTRLMLRKAFIYVGILVVAVTLANVWLIREQVDYTTVLSVIGAGLALALHQVLLCVTAWVMLHVERQYEMGDRVQIGEVKGDVSDIGILHTTLVEIGNWVDADQSTGRLVSVPNSHIFTQAIYNYTRGFHYIWNEISVMVTFESNWRKAQKIILNAAQEGVEELQEHFRTQIRRMARRYMILYQHVTPIVYPRIRDSGVELTLRYLTEPKRRRGTEARVAAQILDAFAAEPDIEFAYPTTRFYDASREGKSQPHPEPAPPETTEEESP